MHWNRNRTLWNWKIDWNSIVCRGYVSQDMEEIGVPRNCKNLLVTPWLPLGTISDLHIGGFWVRSVVKKLNWVTSEDNCGIENTIVIRPS